MRITVEDASGRRVVIDGDDLEKAADTAERDPWDGTFVAGALLKAEEERRFTLCIAYPCNRADKATAADSHIDFAQADSIERAAWDYMLKHRKIGMDHRDGTDNAGDLVESSIHRGPDWSIKTADGNEYVVKEGDWVIGVVWPQNVWDDLIKTGRRRGVSMQGSAIRRTPDPGVLAMLRTD